MRQRSAVAGITGTPSVRGSASDRVWHHAPLEQVAEASKGRFPQPLSMRSRTASSASSLVALYKRKSCEYSPFGSRGDVLRIAREDALRVPGRRGRDISQPGRDLVLGELDRQPPRCDVELDHVAVAQRRDWAAARGLG